VLWFSDNSQIKAQAEVTEADLDVCLASLLEGGKQWTSDNRIGVSRTLHRISSLKNRIGRVVGLTYRIGRHIPGIAEMIKDCVWMVSSRKNSTNQEGEPFTTPTSASSMLLLGPPGAGKTTLLRDVARSLSQMSKRVMIIDTSNELVTVTRHIFVLEMHVECKSIVGGLNSMSC